MRKISGIGKKKMWRMYFFPIEDEPQKESSGQHESSHEEEKETEEEKEEEEQPQSPTTNAGSSPSSPSSTPVRFRRLRDIYASCNFCIVELKYFEQAVKDEVWVNTIEEETSSHDGLVQKYKGNEEIKKVVLRKNYWK